MIRTALEPLVSQAFSPDASHAQSRTTSSDPSRIAAISPDRPRPTDGPRDRRAAACRRAGLAIGVLAGLAASGSAFAFNYVTDASGTWWGVQDAAPPRVDTGSIRATQIGPGQTPAYSTTLNGYGGIKVTLVLRGARLKRDLPPPRLDGELMRGFGLAFDGTERFATTQSVDLGGVTISRSILVRRSANWTRWLDTFTNTTGTPLTVKVAFGGQSGQGDAGTGSR